MPEIPAPMLPAVAIEGIRKRRPYRHAWSIGYLTKGGTYIIASAPNTTDSGKPNDLVAILPGDLGHGRVVQLWVATNPLLVSHIEDILAGKDV